MVRASSSALDRIVLCCFECNHPSSVLPNLDTMRANEPLGGGNGRRVIYAAQRFKSLDMAIAANQIGPIIGHHPSPSYSVPARNCCQHYRDLPAPKSVTKCTQA